MPGAGESPQVVLEATHGWYWAAHTLAAGFVHLAHLLGVKAFAYRRVNDEKDAADLADLLRMGRLPEAWIAPAEIRELRELTGTGSGITPRPRPHPLRAQPHLMKFVEITSIPQGV